MIVATGGATGAAAGTSGAALGGGPPVAVDPSPSPTPSTPGTPSAPNTPTTPSVSTTPVGAIAGNDISWPQCSKEQGGFGNPMPDGSARFVVIGLSSGRAFTENPCLAGQLAFARDRHLLVSAYVFPTYPTNPQYATYGVKGPYSTKTVQGRLMNVGWQQAAYWTTTAKRVGLRTPMVWVDVEQRRQNYRWPARPADRNLPVIKGLLAGLKHYGYRTGIYTTSSHWAEVTGGVRLGLPEWRTVGNQSAAVALGTCGKPGNQGSPVLLAQYFTPNVDHDLLCPVMTSTYRARYFRQY
jgi:hypothetical protein